LWVFGGCWIALRNWLILGVEEEDWKLVSLESTVSPLRADPIV
jgi:hypothetical protein